MTRRGLIQITQLLCEWVNFVLNIVTLFESNSNFTASKSVLYGFKIKNHYIKSGKNVEAVMGAVYGNNLHVFKSRNDYVVVVMW